MRLRNQINYISNIYQWQAKMCQVYLFMYNYLHEKKT